MTDIDHFFSDYALPGVLIFTMAGMGNSLTVQDFRRVGKRPKSIIVGLIGQMIILPIIAFLLIGFTTFSPVIKVGFMLIAVCPGGSTSNLVTYLLKGRLALSVSMTAINSILILMSIPLIIHFALQFYMGESKEVQLPIGETTGNIFLTTFLPTLVGMANRHFFPRFAIKIQRPLKFIMPGLLLIVFGSVFFLGTSKTSITQSEYLYLFPFALVLNAASMTAGYFFGQIFELRHRDKYTIAIEVGLQNAALAIYIAESLLGRQEMSVVAVVYSSFTFFTTFGIGWMFSRFGK